MTIGGENSTSTLNLVGFSSGVAQLAPLEMAPWDLMEITCPHMGIDRTISQTQWKASHLLRPGNPHPAAARTISMSSSIRTGAPPNLFLLRDTTYLNTSICWVQTQRSSQACAQRKPRPAMKQFAQSRRLEERRFRLQRIARFQMSLTMPTFHHFPWPCDQRQHRHRDLKTWPVT